MDTRSSDQELLAEAQQGSLDAFEILYHKYEHSVFRTAWGILGDRQAAEEVLQDCFVRTHRHLNHLHGDPSVGPWLHRVTVNLCYSRLRRNYLSRMTIPLEEISDRLFNARGLSPEEKSENNEVKAAVHSGIEALDAKHRAVVVLYYLQDLPLEEISSILECPVGTVKSRLFHARRDLCQRLASLRARPVPAAA